MQRQNIPNIGQWYKCQELSAIFEVIDNDISNNDGVTIQFVDGNIEAIDSESWSELHVAKIAAPEDWSSPFEIVNEDLDLFMDEINKPNTWNNPVDAIEPDAYVEDWD